MVAPTQAGLALTATELAGTIEMRAAPGGKGTVVELRVPVDPEQR